MTILRQAGLAFLIAVPIEAVNISLVGMMFDPGPLPSGVLPKLLELEWAFFHYVSFYLSDRVFGSGSGGVLIAFFFAYVQTAFCVFLLFKGVHLFQNWAANR